MLDYGLVLDPDVVSGSFGFTRGTYFTWIAQHDRELTSLGLPIMLPQFEGFIWILDLGFTTGNFLEFYDWIGNFLEFFLGLRIFLWHYLAFMGIFLWLLATPQDLRGSQGYPCASGTGVTGSGIPSYPRVPG